MSSKEVRQKTPDGSYPGEIAVNTQGTLEAPEPLRHEWRSDPHEETSELMERVVERENMKRALRRVEQNKGAAGIDGMEVKDLRPYLSDNWLRIKEELLKGTYKPKPVKRVNIPKPDAGIRNLGIPTVLDRLIQQALLQILSPIFDPTFSEGSFGFRPGRSAHQALRKAQRATEEGYGYVVDIDFKEFFDCVNHDVLMARVARRVRDKRILKLIGAYLRAGIMARGVLVATEEGTPQGGPLSPLLANILLDDLDKELEKRGHKFSRYADDVNIYVKSRRAGERVMESVKGLARRRLKLRVNEEKSAVDKPQRRKFLGFSFWFKEKKPVIRLASKTLKRFKAQVRRLTSRSWGVSIEQRLAVLNTYLRGWINYFKLIDTPSVLESLDQWIRRRLRMCLLKQWKKPRTRGRKLVSLGLPEEWARLIAGSRKGCWRLSKSPQMNKALGLAYWQNLGLVSLSDMYRNLRYVS